MAHLGRQAVVLSVARFANYGLLLLSPMILVRLLPVEVFGRYREFMVYASVLQWIAAFTINDSLLYFVPSNPHSAWRVVRQTNLLTLLCSSAVMALVALVDLVTRGSFLGQNLLPVAAYVLLYVNVDFWESYWLATNRPSAVFAYSAMRLVIRMVVVVTAAKLSSNASTIIWSLIAFEAARLACSLALWKKLENTLQEPKQNTTLREQMQFCIPTGFSALLIMVNRNMGNIAVTRVLGVVPLAHYTIGLYGDPIFQALSNSISTIILPEMIRRRAEGPGDDLSLWRRAVVVNCVLLFPMAAFLLRYAEPLIVTVFGTAYLSAVPVFQINTIVMIRSCFDFAPPLRAIGNTRPMLYTTALALVCNAVALLILLPIAGISGAAVALAISSAVEPLILNWYVRNRYSVSARHLLPWKSIFLVGVCAIVALLVTYVPIPRQMPALVQALAGGILYAVAFGGLLLLARLPEAQMLLDNLSALMPRWLRRVIRR